jgi:2,4'-dihydroxyacetophenone dioxygenase
MPSETNGSKTDAATPFQGEQPYGMPADLVVPKIMDLENTDEKLWVWHRQLSIPIPLEVLKLTFSQVPQAPGVSFRPLLLNTSQGYFVNILRVKKSGVLSRHQHTGPVVAVTLKGRWHYLEHDWWAEEGGLSFEPPGETHTLVVPEGCDEMYTLFHVTGAYVYVDPYGKPEKIEDVFSKLKLAREHYEKIGLGAGFVDQFIRWRMERGD